MHPTRAIIIAVIVQTMLSSTLVAISCVAFCAYSTSAISVVNYMFMLCDATVGLINHIHSALQSLQNVSSSAVQCSLT